MKAYTVEEVRELLAKEVAAFDELRAKKYLFKAEFGQAEYRKKYMFHRLRIEEFRAKLKRLGENVL